MNKYYVIYPYYTNKMLYFFPYRSFTSPKVSTSIRRNDKNGDFA